MFSHHWDNDTRSQDSGDFPPQAAPSKTKLILGVEDYEESLPELTRCPNRHAERASQKEQSPPSMFGKALRVVVGVVDCLGLSDSSDSGRDGHTCRYTGTPPPRRKEVYPYPRYSSAPHAVDRVGYISQGRLGMELSRGSTRSEPEPLTFPRPVWLGDNAYNDSWYQLPIERHSPVSYNSLAIGELVGLEMGPADIEGGRWQVTGYYPGPNAGELCRRLEVLGRYRDEEGEGSDCEVYTDSASH